jgi:hypothetical protein
VQPIVAAYKKPASLVKKIYQNARRSNMKKKEIPEEKDEPYYKGGKPSEVLNYKDFKNRNKYENNTKKYKNN